MIAVTLLVIISCWAVTALSLDLHPLWLKVVAVTAYVAIAAGLLRWPAGGRWRLAAGLGLNGLVIGGWLTLRPAADQVWAPEFARQPWAERTGQRVVLHEVRNFSYRKEHDFTVRWETREVDLEQIIGADLFLTRWGVPLVAHAMLSFRFADGRYLATSIEARRTATQEFSAFRGFFRQFQVSYLLADERDVVRLRTNYRTGEEVCLYRTRLKPVDARALFEAYLGWMNAARLRPEWYNSLTRNCSTPIIAYLADAGIGGISRWDWRGVLDGSGDRMLYQLGDLAGDDLPFDQLKRQALINSAARRFDAAGDFSARIRAGRAGFEPAVNQSGRRDVLRSHPPH